MKSIVCGLLTLLTFINNKAVDLELDKKLEDGLYAEMETSKGTMLIKLYEKEAPMTVANFVGLAEGTIENTAKEKGKPFYDGLIFHRIIKDFMIQGGDPTGTGMGGPGYKFADEKNELKHDSKGMLSMANSGPNTNGSQFFITEVPTPWLDGRHTIFGKVIEGIQVVDSLANVKTGANDKPVEDIKIIKLTIKRKGKEYKKYDGAEAFEKAKQAQVEKEKKAKEEAEKKLTELKAGMTTSPTGLMYKILANGTGTQAEKGKTVAVHYTGMLTDGTVFDSSYNRNQPIEFPLGAGRVIPGWDEGIALLKEGGKAKLLIPPHLAYGARGAGGVIPPNAHLIFDVELVKVK
ncbi:MAG: peptidylprolyl isomerase [Flavobacteriales bacterium]|nr:peptidylprolyl isomerase [Flavobacteriales bacterium]